MRLFIAEKPSVAKAIAGELGATGKGDGYIECGNDTITWCFGHMLEQADPDAYTPDDVPRNPTNGKKIWRVEELPIIPETWIMQPRDDAKAQLAVIERLLKKATEIVNAGDPTARGSYSLTKCSNTSTATSRCVAFGYRRRIPYQCSAALLRSKTTPSITASPVQRRHAAAPTG